MATEAKRGFIRICANYTRLISNIVLGLILIPLLLEAVGNDGWALIALLGSTMGLASMVQEIVRSSLIRELGAAYHSKNTAEFQSVYNSAMFISAVLGVIAAAVFMVLWFCLPLLEIPEGFMGAARWLVIAGGTETIFALFFAAPFNMYKVTERMVAYNLWLLLRRSCNILAAIWIIFLVPSDDPNARVTSYAIMRTSFYLLALLSSISVIVYLDRRLFPRPSKIQADSIKAILKVGGLNGGATAATMSYRRLAPLLMNLSFGLGGNLILSLAIQLTVSVRRLTMGMTDGLDAVSTRLSITKNSSAIKSLMHHSTRLHAFATFPLAVGILVLAEPALRLWLGARLDNPDQDIPRAVLLVQIMTIGMASRAISDCWIRILYGAGHVKRYAPLVITGGLLFPITFFLIKRVMPPEHEFAAVCWAYSAVIFIIHFLMVPLFSAKALNLRYYQFYAPLIRPLIIAALCSPILFLTRRQQGSFEFVWLCVGISSYAMLYCGLCVAFVMDRAERERFSKAAIRRIPFLKSLSN